jgi:oligopeptide/dipeptide ABC transporter ATP-binding protein
MHKGRIIECAARDSFFAAPLHPYSRQLLAISENIEQYPALDPINKLGTSAISYGCQFSLSCSRASLLCQDLRPVLGNQRPGHSVACHHPCDDSPPVDYKAV